MDYSIELCHLIYEKWRNEPEINLGRLNFAPSLATWFVRRLWRFTSVHSLICISQGQVNNTWNVPFWAVSGIISFPRTLLARTLAHVNNWSVVGKKPRYNKSAHKKTNKSVWTTIRLKWTFWDILRHFGTIRKTFWRVWSISQSFPTIFSHNRLGHFGTFWDILGHLETFWDI